MVHLSSTHLAKNVFSFGFSGAGFLACYHLGVAKCLLEHKLLPSKKCDEQSSIPMIGVSSGALVAAAIHAGIDPDLGMEAVLSVNNQTRRAGTLKTLQPGYSLVDETEKLFSKLLRKAVDDDPTYFVRRIKFGSLLHVGLTDRRVFQRVGQNPKAFVYVDTYRDIEDVVAACILSSYVPGITGPAFGSLDSNNPAILNAYKRLKEMVALGFVKKGFNGETLQLHDGSDSLREICWDGGLVNAFPFIDANTVIITPIAATFAHNKSINPSVAYTCTEQVRYLQLNQRVRVHLTAENLASFRCITFGDQDHSLEAKFSQGYDNALRFLEQKNLLTTYNVPVSSSDKVSPLL